LANRTDWGKNRSIKAIMKPFHVTGAHSPICNASKN